MKLTPEDVKKILNYLDHELRDFMFSGVVIPGLSIYDGPLVSNLLRHISTDWLKLHSAQEYKQKQVDVLLAELASAREVIEFYADKGHFGDDSEEYIGRTMGTRAREWLVTNGEQKDGEK